MDKNDDVLEFSRYLFVFAHPDDEIYTSAFIANLVQSGKTVDTLYVTSGDYNGADVGLLREKETLTSMKILGIPEDRTHFLRISEHKLMEQLGKACEHVLTKAEVIKPDCIVGHDFEGGHNGHDAVSFCASRAAEKLEVPLYAFPAYHGWPENRLWNQFVSPREATYTATLTEEQQELKESIISANKSQEGFFNTIKASSSGVILFTREVLRRVTSPMDYTSKPTTPVGYEYPGGRIRFEDFIKAIDSTK